ncbi:hypothetical protein ONZ45_g9442 [Pleurotus djamor]|nr:hypothetical protein ONZ45_g9442 [Pleurotus djamor]
MKSCASLPGVLADPGKRKSERLEDTAFYLAHGVTFYDFLSNPQNTRYNERLNQAMIGWELVTGKEMLPKIYPWERLPPGSTVVDVGGGNGHAVLPLLREFPNLNIVVQDTPTVVTQGKQYWEREFPEAVEARKVERFTMYLLYVQFGMSCTTGQMINAFSSVRKAANPTSRLLLHEFVPPHIVDGALAVEKQAPAPLLPNWGAGSKRLYQLDITAMHMFNSKERTLDALIDLVTFCGFEFVKVWDGGEASLVEFVPV